MASDEHDSLAVRGAHYKADGFQAWDVTRNLRGDMAQAWQYVWRCDSKNDGADAITDLRKALAFLEDWGLHCSGLPNEAASRSEFAHATAMAGCGLPRWKQSVLLQIFIADRTGNPKDCMFAIRAISKEIESQGLRFD